MSGFITLFPAADLPEGEMRRVMAGKEALVVVHQQGQWYALMDACSHEAVPLSEGYLEPGRICCAQHGAAFDLRNGEVLTPPAYEAVAVRQVRVTAGMVEVEGEA
ncbi:MAG TPA: non-heme iron oxygenase ferredoxin subunit [bacterium]|nr:non-heme iron oxygenase ferredoxin subunit [bacterium]HQG44364.1 non-heme iron oxygenase ferredoxin subunit [bacterium]HQI47142.1 non-heme iron oxygenase ferredoxin subunit [bacterium]HQJ63140.1 non-heme iron oxygenase ferredoxin subunit [bacterium]